MKVRFHWVFAGMNAISEQTELPLALLEDSPVQVYGAEHYCAAQHDGTCSAAPIHDRDGKIIGVLNMAGKRLVRNASHHGACGIGGFFH